MFSDTNHQRVDTEASTMLHFPFMHEQLQEINIHSICNFWPFCLVYYSFELISKYEPETYHIVHFQLAKFLIALHLLVHLLSGSTAKLKKSGQVGNAAEAVLKLQFAKVVLLVCVSGASTAAFWIASAALALISWKMQSLELGKHPFYALIKLSFRKQQRKKDYLEFFEVLLGCLF